jgi:hypothetical protein
MTLTLTKIEHVDVEPVAGERERYIRRPIQEQMTVTAKHLHEWLMHEANAYRLNSKSRAFLMRIVLDVSVWAAEVEARDDVVRGVVSNVSAAVRKPARRWWPFRRAA